MSVLIQLALLGDAAWACTCIGTRVGFVSPAENATDVPRNAVFRLFMYNGFPVSEYHIVENGVERTDTEQSYRDFGPHNMVEVRLDEPYAPDSVVQVFADDDETPGLTFHVGDQIDDTPPEWGGEFDVVSRIEDFGRQVPSPRLLVARRLGR